MTDELLHLDAFSIAARIRTRAVAATEVVEAFIRRSESVNPTINALVVKCYEQAFVEAQEADKRIRAGDHAPLLGVPFTVKESFAVDGLAQTNGAQSRREAIATEDACAVTRLKQAGAILIGKTNVPELCMWMETSNLIYGRTNNPYNPARTAGGSSGGEGALVATGGSAFGLATDVGGSIRIPAAFCGVFGHKPTMGLVPMTGHWPFTRGAPPRDSGTGQSWVAGPITRHASDLMPLLRILAGPDGNDPFCQERELADPNAVDWPKIKVFFITDPLIDFTSRTTLPVQNAVLESVEVFTALGAKVVPFDTTLFKKAVSIWSHWLEKVEGVDVNQGLGVNSFVELMQESVQSLMGRGRISFAAQQLCYFQRLMRLSPVRQKFWKEANTLRQQIAHLLGKKSIIVMPTYPRTAPRHHMAWLAPLDNVYTGIMNILHVPVTAVPVGLDGNGMPIGISVVGGPGQDHLTIAAAGALEEALGGWSMPKGV